MPEIVLQNMEEYELTMHMNLVLYFIYGIKIFRIHDNNLSDSTLVRRWVTLFGARINATRNGNGE